MLGNPVIAKACLVLRLPWPRQLYVYYVNRRSSYGRCDALSCCKRRLPAAPNSLTLSCFVNHEIRTHDNTAKQNRHYLQGQGKTEAKLQANQIVHERQYLQECTHYSYFRTDEVQY